MFATSLLCGSCLILASLFHIAPAAKFPSNWKKCPKVNNEACLSEQIPLVFADLKDGKKEVGIIPIDPLHFQRMELSQGANSAASTNITFTELDIIGASRIKLHSAKFDWDNYDIQVTAEVLNGPAFLIGDYETNGKVLLLPIKGKGKANITLENLLVDLSIKGSEQIKNGKKYFHADKSRFVIKPKNTRLYFSNLFDGVPNLGESMNKFLNENNHEIMKELNETIAQAIGAGVTEVANQFFSRIPVTELYT